MYRCAKQCSELTANKRGAKVDELHLTPLDLSDRLADLVLPLRTHRHRYFGVLAPNSTLRVAVTAAVAPPQPATVQSEAAITGLGISGPAPPGDAVPLKAQTCAAKACSPLPMGGVDSPHRRGVSATVPAVRWADAHHRFNLVGRCRALASFFLSAKPCMHFAHRRAKKFETAKAKNQPGGRWLDAQQKQSLQAPVQGCLIRRLISSFKAMQE